MVEVLGEGVEHVRPGDRVVIGWRSPCGECRWCLRGARHLCRTPPLAARRMRTRDGRDLMGVFQTGTFATRTVLPGAALVPVAADLPAEEACLIGCAVATGVCSVLKTAEVWEGARVGVIGCGAVGLSVVQGARLAGAARSTHLTSTSGNSSGARFGATHTGAEEANRLDFVFDVVGRPETVAQGISMLGHAGTLVYIGLPQPGAEATLPLGLRVRPAATDPRLTRRRPCSGGGFPAADAARARRSTRPGWNGHEADRVGRHRAGVRGHGGRRGHPLGDRPVRLPPPVADLLGIELVEAGGGECTMKLEAGEQHSNPMGTIHGGTSATSPTRRWACPSSPRSTKASRLRRSS